MENIFSTLKNNMPKASEKDEKALKALDMPVTDLSAMSTKDLVASWQKRQTPETTEEVLKRMRPTITAAMNSYAPGMETQLSIKAAKLTLSALKGYNPAFGTEPSTFVFHNLKRLNRIGAESSNILKQSETETAHRARVRELMARFEDDKGREPSMNELADMTGFSKRKLERLLEDNLVLSESSTLSDDSFRDTQAGSALGDNDYFEYVYSSVGPVDQKIMEWASGMHGKRQLSNNEIAARLKISAAAVSQHKAKLQQKLSEVRGLL